MEKEIFIDIEAIPNKSYVVRGYNKKDSLDYIAICLVEPRGKKKNKEYEICKWLVKSDKIKNYIPYAINGIIRIIKPKKLTGTFEKKKYKLYKRYFKKYGFDIPIIKEFKATYNNVVGEFYYIEIIKVLR